MHKTVKRWLVACSAVAIVVGTVAGLALATGGGSGTISACARTTGGQLRLDTGDGCLPSEQAVQLGTAAASRADERFYVAPNLSDPSTMLPLPNGGLPSVFSHIARVVTMHVPAGNYAIASQITLINHTGDGSVVCLLLDSSNRTHGYAETSVGIDAGYNRNETMTIDGALSLSADDDISLGCWNDTGNAQVDPGTALVRAADITTKSVDAASITQETH
jgi:hypothetical protein